MLVAVLIAAATAADPVEEAAAAWDRAGDVLEQIKEAAPPPNPVWCYLTLEDDAIQLAAREDVGFVVYVEASAPTLVGAVAKLPAEVIRPDPLGVYPCESPTEDTAGALWVSE